MVLFVVNGTSSMKFSIFVYKCSWDIGSFIFFFVFIIKMVERTEIEKYVRHMVALDVLGKPFKTLGDRAWRRENKLAKMIADCLIEKYDVGERVFVEVEKIDEEKARTLREGVEAFKKEFPRYGKILEEMIKGRRIRKNKYLRYGLNEDFVLGSEDYISVMKDLGFEREEACAVYPHIKVISERLGKSKEQSKRLILL